MSSMGSTEHPVVPNDMNQNQHNAPYSSPFINRPSIFSGSHQQIQPFSAIVNPEMPISHPNVFQWPTTTTHESALVQQSNTTPLNLPENGVPWKCPEWMANQNLQPGSYMNFNGHQHARLPFKRKAALGLEAMIQPKQLITDEKMAAHLNGLHISSEFTAHNVNQSGQTNSAFEMDDNGSDTINPYPCTFHDIEEKLKRAQKITVSDVVKSIQEDPILPAAIMERFEKPCKALVIWQPPQRITDLIVSKTSQQDQASDDESNDNNNDGFRDANCTDMELE